MKKWLVTRLFDSNYSTNLQFARLDQAQAYCRRAQGMGWTVSAPWQKI